MDVILTKDVSSTGRAGQVVKVKDGYARNFLFPNKLAVPMTGANMKQLEQEKTRRAQEQEKNRAGAEELKVKLAAVSLTIPVLVQEEEKLYGSIGAQEIAQALKDDGIELDKALLQLDEPIKKLGIYEVPVKLHPEVTATLKIWIVKK